MSGTTSVPSPVFGPRGFVAPSEADILNGAQADLNAAFGGDLNPALETPQGQIASSLAAIVGDKNDQFLKYVNMVDPALASGRMQDAIARIYFIERDPARATVTYPACVGRSGVVIPVGALIQAADGNVYSCTQAGVIPPSGSVKLLFACLVTGPIACPPQPFTIYQTIPGWDAAVSAEAGVLGNVVEGRAAFEERRAASVALNGRGSIQAIRAAVLAVPNVLDALAVENTASAPATIGGVLVGAHSIYVAVSGGDSQAVAKAIWSKKDTGADYTGNTAVTVYDDSYGDPRPAYYVRFQRPAATTIFIRVRVANSGSVPADAEAMVEAAVLSAFAGSDDGPRARIGGQVFASRFYAGVAALGFWARIVDIQVSTDGSTFSDTLALNIDQQPVTSAAAISLVLV